MTERDPPKFRKVLLLSDTYFSDLAARTQGIIKDYAKIDGRDIPGGIHDYDPDDLVIESFGNREVGPTLKRTVRGRDVFLLKSFVHQDKYDPNVPLIEIYLVVDALKRAQAGSVTLVAPYIPYLRQDRFPLDELGVPKRQSISARVIADMFVQSGLDGLLTIDPHFAQFSGFFPNTFNYQHLPMRVEFIDHLLSTIPSGDLEKYVIFSPDFGGGDRAEYIARPAGITFGGLCRKERPEPGKVGMIRLLKEDGIDIQGKKMIIVDDMVDSGGTLIFVSDKLREELVQEEVLVYATHGIFSKETERLSGNRIVPVISESIPLKKPGVTNLELHRMLGVGIYNMISGKSFSRSLFDYPRFKKIKTKLEFQAGINTT